MKKITFLMCSMGRGGSERVVSILSKYYCDMGWKVNICMLWHNINEYVLDERVKVLDFSFEKMGTIKRITKMLMSLRKYIKKENPDVLVPFHAKTSALFWIATFGIKLRNIRVVASERIDPYSVNYSRFLRILINKAYRKADAIVFQTKRAKSYYQEKIQAKSVIIGNPITMDILSEDDGTHTIITAGRLTEQKNHKMLISAFAEIANIYPQYSLHIYGEGELRNELEEQIYELGMKDRIFLMGNSLDYQQKLAKAEIFVLPSNYEGLSNALLEAMLMGKPCISTDCAGSDEIIEDHVNGILTPVGNQKAMQKAIAELIIDTNLKMKIARNAKISCEKFSTKNVIGQWRNVFEG